MNKRLTPFQFWSANAHKYDTYMVTSSGRISFHIDDLYRFMERYANHRMLASNRFIEDEDIEVLEEHRDLMEDVISGDYTPDSLTNQPLNALIHRLKYGDNE